MPDYFTHAIAAEKIYDRLQDSYRQKIKDADLYRLGAQGGDLFFTYSLRVNGNIGRVLHGMNNVKLFTFLRSRDEQYAAGFAAHYALDSALHPIIYAFEATSSAPFAHIRFEGDIGLYVSRLYSIPRRIMPRDRVMRCGGRIYSAVKELMPEISQRGIERCLARHYAYTVAALKARRNSYVFGYDYSSLAVAVDDAVSFGADCVRAIFDGNISPSLFGKSFLEKPSPNTGS